MKKFKLGSLHVNKRSIFSFMSRYGLILLLVLIFLTQVERFTRDGSLLGYRVKKAAQSSAMSTTQAETLFGVNQKSLACDKASEDVVSRALNQKVKRTPGFISDRTMPRLYSNCRYSTVSKDGKNTRSVIIVLRGEKDKAAALQALESLNKTTKPETVKMLGDKAYFSTVTNQLSVVSGDTLVTLVISKNSDTKFDAKTAAIEIARPLIR